MALTQARSCLVLVQVLAPRLCQGPGPGRGLTPTHRTAPLRATSPRPPPPQILTLETSAITISIFTTTQVHLH